MSADTLAARSCAAGKKVPRKQKLFVSYASLVQKRRLVSGSQNATAIGAVKALCKKMFTKKLAPLFATLLVVNILSR